MYNGSLDVLTASIKIESKDISINIIHYPLVKLMKNDILLANVSEAIAFGFRDINDAKAIDTNTNARIIYEIIDDIKIMSGMFKITVETKIGTAST